MKTLFLQRYAKKSQLTSAMYYKNTAGEMNSVNFEGPHLNVGFAKRGALTELGKVVDMMCRIHADMFFQERYMLNEINTRIKLIRSKDAFCVMGNANYKIKLMHASLFVRKVKVMPSVFSPTQNRWNAQLQNTPYAAWYASRLRFRSIIETLITRNCFPVNYRRAW